MLKKITLFCLTVFPLLILFGSWKLAYNTVGQQAHGTLPFKNGYAGAFIHAFRDYQSPYLKLSDQIITKDGFTQIKRNGSLQEVQLLPFTLDAKTVFECFSPLWLTALSFFLIGMISQIFGGSSGSMLPFYAFCSLGASYLSSLYDFHTTYRLCLITTICLGIVPATIIHLGMDFPVPIFKRHRMRWLILTYGIVALFASCYVGAFFFHPELWLLAEKAQVLLLWFSFIFWFVVTRIKWKQSDDPLVQRQCKWIFNSAVFSFGLITTIWVLSLAFNWDFEAMRFAPIMILFPATIAFAMMKFNLFTIDKLNEQIMQVRSALEKTQSELAHSQRLTSIGTLAAGTAHEIGNAMNIVLGNLPVLKKYVHSLTHPEGSSPLHHARVLEDLPILIQDIDQGATRAYSIVEGLKSFSKSVPAEPSRHLTMIKLGDLFKEVSHICQPVLKPGQSIVISVKPDDLEWKLQKEKIQQVLINLIFNSRDASEANTPIKLEAMKTNQGVTMVVEDQGHGIPPDILPHIFDPFFTTKEKGTGLGLSICYGMVQELGGAMRAESMVGQWTRIILEFK